MSGKLEKLTIVPFSDAGYKEVAGDAYVALINPEQMDQEFKVEFSERGGEGSKSTEKIFKMMPSPKMSLKFLFDGTGVINSDNAIIDQTAVGSGAIVSNKSTGGTVSEQIAHFKKVTTDLDGKIHQPGYVKIYWGDITFQGRLSSLKITYTLFKANGDPLRAIGDAVFEESLDHLIKAKEENKNSPDLTHIRIVKGGETLPMMCHRIYKDSKHYLKIARVNKLSNYRNLEAGTKLFFPPIKDED